MKQGRMILVRLLYQDDGKQLFDSLTDFKTLLDLEFDLYLDTEEKKLKE